LTLTEQRYASQERELLPAKYTLNRWHHLLEGSEITIRTDHESLKVYRTKSPMTKCLVRFMDEVEHYDPTIVYRPSKLQVVPDALSCMAGQSEGKPTDTDCFIVAEIENTLFTVAHADAADITPDEYDSCFANMSESAEQNSAPRGANHYDNPETNHTNHNLPYYCRIQRYREKRIELDDTDEKVKAECEKYVLHSGILLNARTGKHIILDLKFIKKHWNLHIRISRIMESERHRKQLLKGSRLPKTSGWRGGRCWMDVFLVNYSK